MTSVSKGPRNQIGLKDLRKRCLRRAEHLLSRDHFRDEIARVRGDWSEAQPRFEIRPDALPINAGVPNSNAFRVFQPATLERDLRECHLPDHPGRDASLKSELAWKRAWDRGIEVRQIHLDWQSLVQELRRDAFPERYFPAPEFDWGSHPMDSFISACLVFTRVSLDRAAIDRITPPFGLRLHNLGYPPPNHVDMMFYVQALGERDYLRTVVRSMLRDDPERFRAVMDEASRHGANESWKRLPDGWWGPDDPAKRWWYVPVAPFVSPHDVQELVNTLPATLGRIFKFPAVDEMIHQLLHEGLKHEQIADLLGVSTDRVTKAKRKMPDSA